MTRLGVALPLSPCRAEDCLDLSAEKDGWTVAAQSLGGAGGGVACQHLGKCVWLRLYVCVCECASVCVSVCVCHTDTILSTLAERGDTNGGGKRDVRTHAL